MRYILRKFVDADTVEQAVALDKNCPVHDAYLKEGEQPKEPPSSVSAVGFSVPNTDEWRKDEILTSNAKKG